jgi:hypothetical protein
MMKRFTLFALLLAVVTITGCKKDPDEKAADNILGKWYPVSSINTDYLNGKVTNRETSTDYSPNEYTEFKSNGTAFDYDGDEYTYKISGSTLTMREKGDDDDEVFEIKKITSSELVIYSESTDEQGTDKYKYTQELTLKKK